MIQRSSSPITSAPLLHGNEEEVHFDPPVRQFVVEETAAALGRKNILQNK